MGTITALLIDNALPATHAHQHEILGSEPDLEVLGEATEGRRALELARRLKPDAILIYGAVELTFLRQLHQENDLAVMVVLTARDEPDEARQTFEAGGSVYCRRDISPAKLMQALRQARRGHYVLDDQVFDKEGLLAHLALRLSVQPSLETQLSRREMDILQSLTQGLSNKEIARVLGISQQTVKNHMTSLLGKFQAGDRTQLTVLALRHGLVRLQDIQSNHSRS
jgi:DNA-binding NarL/FixJ family response regulator